MRKEVKKALRILRRNVSGSVLPLGEGYPESGVLSRSVREWNLLRTKKNVASLNLSGARVSGQALDKSFLEDMGGGLFPRNWMKGIDLRDVDLSHADLRGVVMDNACLSGAYLVGADLNETRLNGAELSKAVLSVARLFYTHASEADWTDADLQGATLHHASMSRSSMIGTDLRDCVLVDTSLVNVDLTGAHLGSTVFSGCDMSGAKGLATIVHTRPSMVDMATARTLPENTIDAFLRGCGLRDEEIAYVRSQVGSPIRFYSCFISYSIDDEAFASRLHNDFQAQGIRCWKWEHDARIGKSMWGEIDQAIRVTDKLVLIASESSLNSPAVIREVERAIRQEDERGENVLFPVRVDDYIFHGWEHERKVDVTKKVIADARGWMKDNKKYEAIRDRLIQDLKTQTVEPFA